MRENHLVRKPQAAIDIDKELGKGIEITEYKPDTKRAERPQLTASGAGVKALPREANSVPDSAFPKDLWWQGKDWKKCCLPAPFGQGGKPVNVKKGEEHRWPGNPAFYVFLLNRDRADPTLKYGKTDYFRSRLQGYTATTNVTVLHLRLWPLYTRKVRYTYKPPPGKLRKRRLDEESAATIVEHPKGTTLEQLLESQVKKRIKDTPELPIQRLGGKDVYDTVSGKVGNFAEFIPYTRERAIKLQEIVLKSEKVYTRTRPFLHPFQPHAGHPGVDLEIPAQESDDEGEDDAEDDESDAYPAQDIPEEVVIANAQLERQRLAKLRKLAKRNVRKATVEKKTRSGRVVREPARYRD